MRRRILGTVLAAVTALTSVSLVAPSAQGSTGGVRDDADVYSNVGLILGYAADGNAYRCSATLIEPTVLLTAAHCTDGILGKMLVDFSPVVAEQPPSPYPVAADPTTGFTSLEIEAEGYRAGEPDTHPDYSGFTDLDSWNDVGVVVLDEPATGVPTAEVAGLGTLDGIRKSNLSETLFRAVGYGTEVRKPESGPQKPTPFSYPLVRRYVDMPGQKLTPQILQTNGNPNDNRGTGGTCFGDSGGPVFLDGEIVAVTSYGLTSNCRYLGGYQRVDIAAAQDWIATVTG